MAAKAAIRTLQPTPSGVGPRTSRYALSRETEANMPDKEPPPLVEIAALRSPIEAHILRSQLADEGIECFLAGDTIVNAVGLPYAGMDNWVRILVREEDAEKAAAIVRPPDIDLLGT